MLFLMNWLPAPLAAVTIAVAHAAVLLDIAIRRDLPWWRRLVTGVMVGAFVLPLGALAYLLVRPVGARMRRRIASRHAALVAKGWVLRWLAAQAGARGQRRWNAIALWQCDRQCLGCAEFPFAGRTTASHAQPSRCLVDQHQRRDCGSRRQRSRRRTLPRPAAGPGPRLRRRNRVDQGRRRAWYPRSGIVAQVAPAPESCRSSTGPRQHQDVCRGPGGRSLWSRASTYPSIERHSGPD